LSNSTGDSFSLQIAAIGNNVYVIWEHNTTPDANNDLFVITSAQPFGIPINISNNPGFSGNPQIVTS